MSGDEELNVVANGRLWVLAAASATAEVDQHTPFQYYVRYVSSRRKLTFGTRGAVW